MDSFADHRSRCIPHGGRVDADLDFHSRERQRCVRRPWRLSPLVFLRCIRNTQMRPRCIGWTWSTSKAASARNNGSSLAAHWCPATLAWSRWVSHRTFRPFRAGRPAMNRSCIDGCHVFRAQRSISHEHVRPFLSIAYAANGRWCPASEGSIILAGSVTLWRGAQPSLAAIENLNVSGATIINLAWMGRASRRSGSGAGERHRYESIPFHGFAVRATSEQVSACSR